MKLDQLRALDAIVVTGTFRKAAERLNKSQSAVSHAIRLLEEEQDLTLFSRETYRPTLTPAGEVFYGEAARVLHQVRELQATTQRLRSREEAQLKIAVSATLPLEQLVPVLADVSTRYPATHLHLSTEMMGGPITRLMEQEADIVFATLDDVPMGEVETMHVVDVMICPMASRDLANRLGPGPLSDSKLQAVPQIIVTGTGRPGNDQSRDLLTGGRKWTVSDFTAKKNAILGNLGWGGLPTHMAQGELQDGSLVELDVMSFPPRLSSIFAMRRRGSARGPVASALWERLDGASP